MSEDDPDAARPPRRRFGTAGIALGTAVIALASGGVGLLFDLKPNLRPDPQTRKSATLSVAAIEPHVRYSDWILRTSPSPDKATVREGEVLKAHRLEPGSKQAGDQLRLDGMVFYIDTTIEGLKKDHVRVRWSMYDARRATRVKQGGMQDVDAADVRLESPADRAVIQVWTPLVGSVHERGPFFARFELRDRNGSTLAIADSRRFRAAS